jgi:hypothetical protein
LRRVSYPGIALQLAEKLGLGQVLGRARLHRLRKNSDSSGFWEGHEFTRAVKSLEMCLRFSARGVHFAARRVFPQAIQRWEKWRSDSSPGGTTEFLALKFQPSPKNQPVWRRLGTPISANLKQNRLRPPIRHPAEIGKPDWNFQLPRSRLLASNRAVARAFIGADPEWRSRQSDDLQGSLDACSSAK